MERPGGTDYNIMVFEECPKCKIHEPDFSFKNCSFTIHRKSDGKAQQVFQCTVCKFEWKIDYQ